MNLLLDTHTLLWFYSGAPELSEKARNTIEDSGNDFFVSMASLWEISIKTSIGKLEISAPLPDFFNDLFSKGFRILNIAPSHILRSAIIPFHHRDPFDRLLIGQALFEKMPLISKDSVFEPYVSSSGLKLIW